jgi:hypothetical protein
MHCEKQCTCTYQVTEKHRGTFSHFSCPSEDVKSVKNQVISNHVNNLNREISNHLTFHRKKDQVPKWQNTRKQAQFFP